MSPHTVTRPITAYHLLSQMCFAASRPLHVTLGFADPNHPNNRWIADPVSDWAGGEKEGSMAWLYGPAKAQSMLHGGDTNVPCMGPTTYWMDPKLWGAKRDGLAIAACSAWDQYLDALMAIIGVEVLKGFDLKMHHFAVRQPTLPDLFKAVAAAEQKYNTSATWPEAEDHVRAYVPVPTGDGRGVRHYLEFYVMPGITDPEIHWDLVHPDPVAAIDMFENDLAGHANVERWQVNSLHDLAGVVSVHDPRNGGPDGMEVGIMFRGAWSNYPVVAFPGNEEIEKRLRRMF